MYAVGFSPSGHSQIQLTAADWSLITRARADHAALIEFRTAGGVDTAAAHK